MNEMASTAGAVTRAWSGYPGPFPNPFLQYWTQALDGGHAKGGRGGK